MTAIHLSVRAHGHCHDVAVQEGRIAYVGSDFDGLEAPRAATTVIEREGVVLRERELAADHATQQRYRAAVERGDPDYVPIWAGEAADLITTLGSATALVRRIADEAENTIRQALRRKPTSETPL
jgi:hypothetical protein